MLPIWLTILIAVIVGVVALAIAFPIGIAYRRKTAEAKISSAEEEAKRIINDAIKTAEQKRKETIIEAKDEAFRLKAEADKEIKERRGELSRQERRLDQKEESVDKKTEALEQKEDDLRKRAELAEARLGEIEQMKARELEKLETISALTQEDAKKILLDKMDEQLTHEKALRITAYETQLKDEADSMGR
ncbi:MAG: Rnase Y domain-containing protein, partial [Oscillospiraceae bacterium]